MKFHTKASPGLVALGAGAVIAVYTAGFVKTRAAAARFEELPAMRRPAPNPPAIVPIIPPVATAPARAEARQPASAPASARRTSAKPVVSPRRVATGMPATTAAVPPPPTSTKTPDAATPASAAPAIVTSDTSAAATDVASTPVEVPAPPKSLYRDGTYSGWGTSRHGEIEATVVIEGGRITSAAISNCQTRYPCSFIANLPPQVVIRQSADVDYVSGATQSADAFYYAVLQALSKAR